MSSTDPDRYMDANDIRMMRNVLKRAGYRLTDNERQKSGRREAAQFLIRQFGEGVSDAASMLDKLQCRRAGPPGQRYPNGPRALENEGRIAGNSPG
jgi:hypothetical protein